MKKKLLIVVLLALAVIAAWETRGYDFQKCEKEGVFASSQKGTVDAGYLYHDFNTKQDIGRCGFWDNVYEDPSYANDPEHKEQYETCKKIREAGKCTKTNPVSFFIAKWF